MSGRRAIGALAAACASPAACAALAAAAAWVFLPVLGHGFFGFDDYENFVDNPMVHGLDWARVRWMFTSLHMTTYQPFAWLAAGGIWSSAGPSPRAFHAASVALHAANALCLGLVIGRVLALEAGARPCPGRWALSFAAAFLWAAHPGRVGVVAWATKLSDLLAALFFLLACLAYLARWETPQGLGRVAAAAGGRNRLGLRLSAAFFAASGLCRWSGVSLPLVLVLLDLHPLGRLAGGWRGWLSGPARRVWIEKWPFAAVALALALVNAQAKAQIGGIRLLHGLGHPLDCALAAAFYLRASMRLDSFPILCAVNGSARPAGLPGWAALILALCLAAALVRFRKAWPAGLGAGIFWLAALLPTFAASWDGLVYAQDAYAYIPSMVFALLLAQGLLALRRRLPSGGLVAPGCLASLLALAFVSASRRQAAFWGEPEKLWRQTLKVDPGLWIGHHNLAVLLGRAGRWDEAKAEFEETLRLRPGRDAWERRIEEALRQMPAPRPPGPPGPK